MQTLLIDCVSAIFTPTNLPILASNCFQYIFLNDCTYMYPVLLVSKAAKIRPTQYLVESESGHYNNRKVCDRSQRIIVLV